jgi:hypothetical protein
MNKNIDYSKKYLKYKNKYIELKNSSVKKTQSGGNIYIQIIHALFRNEITDLVISSDLIEYLDYRNNSSIREYFIKAFKLNRSLNNVELNLSNCYLHGSIQPIKVNLGPPTGNLKNTYDNSDDIDSDENSDDDTFVDVLIPQEEYAKFNAHIVDRPPMQLFIPIDINASHIQKEPLGGIVLSHPFRITPIHIFFINQILQTNKVTKLVLYNSNINDNMIGALNLSNATYLNLLDLSFCADIRQNGLLNIFDLLRNPECRIRHIGFRGEYVIPNVSERLIQVLRESNLPIETLDIRKSNDISYTTNLEYLNNVIQYLNTSTYLRHLYFDMSSPYIPEEEFQLKLTELNQILLNNNILNTLFIDNLYNITPIDITNLIGSLNNNVTSLGLNNIKFIKGGVLYATNRDGCITALINSLNLKQHITHLSLCNIQKISELCNVINNTEYLRLISLYNITGNGAEIDNFFACLNPINIIKLKMSSNDPELNNILQEKFTKLKKSLILSIALRKRNTFIPAEIQFLVYNRLNELQ